MLDRQAILAKVASRNWFHAYEIVPGIVSPGRAPTDARKLLTDRYNLPNDLTGITVLDIGALDGPHSFEMERRGARVTALDIQNPDFTGFNIAKEIIGSQAEYVQGSVYDLVSLLPRRKFNLITYFGVWYHLKHPLLALDAIHSALTDDGIVLFEGECLRNHAQAPSILDGDPSDFVRQVALTDVPLTAFYADHYKDDKWSWFVPNAACVHQWFKASALEITTFGFWDDYPHQRMFGAARKSRSAAIDVDNPVWGNR